jgi:hypothetical protein
VGNLASPVPSLIRRKNVELIFERRCGGAPERSGATHPMKQDNFFSCCAWVRALPELIGEFHIDS